MRLRIKGFDINIRFSAILLASFIVISNYMTGYLLCFISVIIHELGHLAAMRAFGLCIEGISVSAFDIRIIGRRSLVPVVADVVISLSGPVTNLLVFIIFLFINPDFAYINLFIGLFNILPASSLDGGQALYLILLSLTDANRASVVIDVITVIISVPLFAAGIYVLLQTRYNFSLLFIGLYLFAGVFIRKDKYL